MEICHPTHGQSRPLLHMCSIVPIMKLKSEMNCIVTLLERSPELGQIWPATPSKCLLMMAADRGESQPGQ